MADFKKFGAAFLLGGVSGWTLENVISEEPHNAKLFDNKPVPFLPVYGFGAVAVVAAAPHLNDLSFWARGLMYSAGLSSLELAACAVDREMGPKPAWDYGQGSCIDVPHAIVWGVLGLVVEWVARAMSE